MENSSISLIMPELKKAFIFSLTVLLFSHPFLDAHPQILRKNQKTKNLCFCSGGEGGEGVKTAAALYVFFDLHGQENHR